METAARPFLERHAGLIFVLALAPRLAHWLLICASPLAGEYVPDLSAYLDAAARMMDSSYFFRAPMLMSPGYALILAPQYILFGPNTPVFALTNAVLDAGSAALCGMLAARLAGPARACAAGLLAGLLYACCGQILFYTLLPLGEGPAIFCLLAGLNLLFGCVGTGGLRAWLAGILLALAALVRPNLLPAELLALAAWTFGPAPRGERLRAVLPAAGRALAGLLLALAPFMGHNLVLEGHATPFGFQGGITFFAGNQPGASGGSDAVAGVGATPGLSNYEAVLEAERRGGRRLTLAQADAFWYAEARRTMAAQPLEAARTLGRKALLLVNDGGRDATMDPDFAARFSPVPGLLSLPAGLVLALAAAGLCAALRRDGRSPERLAVGAAFLALAVLLVLYQVTPRYRTPLLPLGLCLAGPFLAELPDLLRGARRVLVAPAACGVVVLFLSMLPLNAILPGAGPEADKGRLALEHARLAHYYLLKGPARLAVPEYEAALALGAPDKATLSAGLAAARALAGSPPPQ